jgi:hypothetical protein
MGNITSQRSKNISKSVKATCPDCINISVLIKTVQALHLIDDNNAKAKIKFMIKATKEEQLIMNIFELAKFKQQLKKCEDNPHIPVDTSNLKNCIELAEACLIKYQ